MTDMLARLYDLPDAGAACSRLGSEGVLIKRALAMDTGKVLAFVDGERVAFVVALADGPATARSAELLRRLDGRDTAAAEDFSPGDGGCGGQA